MEDNFLSARLESTIVRNYLGKQLKNKSARNFIKYYTESKGELTPDLKRATFIYKRIIAGDLNMYVTDSDFKNISNNEITQVYKIVKEVANQNFKYFYESYQRKIEKGYYKEYVESALADLKDAYYTYRKVNNPQWNLKDSQVTESEMTNLYYLLIPKQEDGSNKSKKLEEK